MIELGGGGEVVSHGSSQCTQETDKHIQCGCRSVLRTRQNGLAVLISEGNAYALLTHCICYIWFYTCTIKGYVSVVMGMVMEIHTHSIPVIHPNLRWVHGRG